MLRYRKEYPPAPQSGPFAACELGMEMDADIDIMKQVSDVIAQGVLWCSWLSRSPHIKVIAKGPEFEPRRNQTSFCCFIPYGKPDRSRSGEGGVARYSALTSPVV